MLFEINNLTKVFGNRTVIDIPALSFEQGFVYALLGPNGSGKTTLLEILSLLSPPTTGRILYNHTPVDFSGNHMHSLRREIVMVHQNPVLFTTTVYKNLEFGLRIRGVSGAERERIIHESLDVVGMREFIGADAHRLSGGETQRVAIARALACSPRVMFFDEPTANVDVENQAVIERIIRDINARRGLSVLFTTHDLVQASRLSQGVISLFEGRQASSTFENIFGGMILTDRDGDTVCRIQDRVGFAVRTDRTGQVRLAIDPHKIHVLRGDDPAPGKNRFRGRLVQLTDEHEFIRAVVDVGIPLNILLPKPEAQSAPLIIGSDLHISCPPEAIRVF
jgi:tungstate transport system ATP-binding protein